jgi:hypothetical protein
VEPKQNPPEVETGGFSFQKIAILDTDSRSQKSTETKLMLVTALASGAMQQGSSRPVLWLAALLLPQR